MSVFDDAVQNRPNFNVPPDAVLAKVSALRSVSFATGDKVTRGSRL
jgi:hypothetical protein